jgi:hypothetical protein
MEALWMDILWKKYAVYDPRSKSAKRNQDTFEMCMWQKWDFMYYGFDVVSTVCKGYLIFSNTG